MAQHDQLDVPDPRAPADRLEIVAIDRLRFHRRFCILQQLEACQRPAPI